MRKHGLILSLVILFVVFWMQTTTSHAQGGKVIHVVQAGETLTSIANYYGVSIDAIVAANKLASADAIFVGQRLIIPLGGSSTGAVAPSSQPGTYTVQPGDTLSGIANKLGVSVDDLITVNKINDPALIQIGQVLKIPGSTVASGPAFPPLPDGQGTLSSGSTGPAI